MTRKILILVLFLISVSCGISRIRTEIPDFVVMPNGKGIVGIKTLNAFVFENSLTNIPFQQFITAKFKTNNRYETELWITADKQKFKLIFYTIDEFEKFFGSQNFTALKQENDSEKYGNQSKFIAISLVNDLNEDCLDENSLFFNIAINYLKNLKNEYVKP
jgi:hypothetical protein